MDLPHRARGFVSRMIEGQMTVTLPTLMGQYLHEVQLAFGARDYSWTPVGVVFSAVGPMMTIPNPERKQALIILSINASHDLIRAAFELAHETVHLLSPNAQGPNATIVLEEGCAEAFSILKAAEIGFHHPKLINPPQHPYEQARQLTLKLLDMDGNAVRKLRYLEPHFSNITPDHFAAALPSVPRDLAEALCGRFQYDEESKLLRAAAVEQNADSALSAWFAARDADEAKGTEPTSLPYWSDILKGLGSADK